MRTINIDCVAHSLLCGSVYDRILVLSREIPRYVKHTAILSLLVGIHVISIHSNGDTEWTTITDLFTVSCPGIILWWPSAGVPHQSEGWGVIQE